MKKKKYLLPSIVIVLMTLSFLTGVIVSDLLLVFHDKTPSSDMSINMGADNNAAVSPSKDSDSQTAKLPAATVDDEETSASATTDITDNTTENNTEDNTEAVSDSDSTSTESPMTTPPTPSAYVDDEAGLWIDQTQVEIFRAKYDNDSGNITVISAYGDKVIAPGTSNSYYFNVNNDGETGIKYTLEAEASISFVYNDQTYKIPIQAKFRDDTDTYLIGSADEYVCFDALDGIKDEGTLRAGYTTRYILDWQWPFEQGNDDFDTFLGNLSAEGDELKVSVKFIVSASEYDGADGGVPPMGDENNVWFFVLLFVVALVMLVILLIMARDKDDSEQTTKLDSREDTEEET